MLRVVALLLAGEVLPGLAMAACTALRAPRRGVWSGGTLAFAFGCHRLPSRPPPRCCAPRSPSRATLAALAASVSAASGGSNCGTAGYEASISTVTLSPLQPIKGQPATLNATGTLNAAITGGAATLTVQLEGVSPRAAALTRTEPCAPRLAANALSLFAACAEYLPAT